MNAPTMKQVAQNYSTGEVSVVEVPVPSWRPGGVLVRTDSSLISIGTERMKVDQAKMSLIGKARARPDQVKQVLESVSQQGIAATYRKVSDRLDSLTPLGYSMAGEVIRSGQGAEDLPVGMRVACGGDQFAFHAEYNWVPKNLCVPIPEGVSPQEAAFTTVGSVALHAVRQADLRLGETAVVIGLGLVGQLIIRILVAAGVRAIGLDLSEARCEMARSGGAVHAGSPDEREVEEKVSGLTDGHGADCVFLATSTSSNQPTELAAELARDRADILDVGNTRLDLPWKAYYEKELNVRFSRSYGPGRYDHTYELQGIDYPIGYVRWTQRRNMGAFLKLIADHRLDVSELVGEVADIEDAEDIYERIHRGDVESVGVLFSYSRASEAVIEEDARPESADRQSTRPADSGSRIGCIGSGNYASSMLLPHLRDMKTADLTAVATTGGLSAVNAQRKFGFHRTTANADEIIEDENIDAVMVLTRHDTHARYVEQGLRSGKYVYVEKPPAVNPSELERIRAAAIESGNSRLMVGYNRRFSPLLAELKSSWVTSSPQSVTYVVNAGQLASDSWYLDRSSHGSRFVGEGGHFVDTISWWLGCDPIEVYARAASTDIDDIQVVLTYADGSVAHIAYMTQGDNRFPKERITFSGDGQSAVLDNYARAELWVDGKRHRFGVRRKIDKGQPAEMEAFATWVAGGPTPGATFDSLMATSATTFAIEASLMTGDPQPVTASLTRQLRPAEA